jgi:hypothetical protein
MIVDERAQQFRSDITKQVRKQNDVRDECTQDKMGDGQLGRECGSAAATDKAKAVTIQGDVIEIRWASRTRDLDVTDAKTRYNHVLFRHR